MWTLVVLREMVRKTAEDNTNTHYMLAYIEGRMDLLPYAPLHFQLFHVVYTGFYLFPSRTHNSGFRFFAWTCFGQSQLTKPFLLNFVFLVDFDQENPNQKM
jgi:hypothetical protein